MVIAHLPEHVTKTIVNTKYFPNKGIVNEVEGIISINTKKKKVSDNIIDTDNVTYNLWTTIFNIF